MVVRDVVPEDFERIEMREYESGTILGHDEEQNMARMNRMVHAVCMGPSKTFEDDLGRIVIIAGIVVLWPGVGEAWLLSARDAMEKGMGMARSAKRELERMAAELKLHRLQAHAPLSFVAAHRWLEFLGMEQESVAQKYTTTGEDAIIFKRIL